MQAEALMNEQRKRIHPHKFVLWVAIAGILMMFAGLTSAFIVKSNLTGWKDIGMPRIFWYSTAAILLSSLTMQMALRAFKQREMRQYRVLTGVTLALGIAFVALQWFGFEELWKQNIRFSGSAGAGQFLYVIFGLHALHVMGGVIALVTLFLKAFLGKVRSYSAVQVEVMATYWHFVDILWIYLLVFFIVIG
jgi:cytochrome c oxidase subunit 3